MSAPQLAVLLLPRLHGKLERFRKLDPICSQQRWRKKVKKYDCETMDNGILYTFLSHFTVAYFFLRCRSWTPPHSRTKSRVATINAPYCSCIFLFSVIFDEHSCLYFNLLSCLLFPDSFANLCISPHYFVHLQRFFATHNFERFAVDFKRNFSNAIAFSVSFFILPVHLRIHRKATPWLFFPSHKDITMVCVLRMKIVRKLWMANNETLKPEIVRFKAVCYNFLL